MAFDPENITVAQQQLLDWVYHRMDYVGVDGQTEAVEVETVWRELVQSARTILMNAPAPKVYLIAEEREAQAVALGTGFSFMMPEPGIRPLSLTCDWWDATVFQFGNPAAGQMYRLQQKRSTVTRRSEPLAFLVPATGRIAIEGYPAPPMASDVEYTLRYIGQPVPTNVPEELQDAMVWEAAALVLIQTRDYEAAQAARQNVPNALITATLPNDDQ